MVKIQRENISYAKKKLHKNFPIYGSCYMHMRIPLQSQINMHFDQTITCLNFEAATIVDEDSYALCWWMNIRCVYI